MLDGVKVILVLVVAGVVGGGALDFLIQFLFQLLVILSITAGFFSMYPTPRIAT